MTQIDRLERRITAALDRIAQGVEAMDAPYVRAADATPQVPAINPEELEALRDELAAEQESNAQLQNRVRALRNRLHAGTSGLQAQIETQREALTTLDLDLQHLRRANDMLVDSNKELRAALEENVAEPTLINKAMLAELESLRAARAVDAAETRSLLASLEPLLAQAASNEAPDSADSIEGETA